MKQNPVYRNGVSIRLSCQGLLRLAIVSALGACTLGLSGGARADSTCQGSPTQNIAAGSYTYGYAVCQGDAGVDKSDEKDGDSGADISIATNGGSFGVDSGDVLTISGYNRKLGVLTGASIGGAGVDEGTAGDGGYITINNSAGITLSGSGTGSYNSLISGVSLGGLADQDNDNNNSDGGNGGLGQKVSITNTGVLTIEGTVPVADDSGLFGIDALAMGGAGGEQNNPTLDYGDQVGGDGANASTAIITDSGTVNLGSSDTRLKTYASGAALSARSIGATGGNYNGNAGTGGTVQVTHKGATSSYWQADGDSKLFGINAESIGGDGVDANPDNPDNSDNGGNGGGQGTGGWTQQTTVDAYGSVLLDVADSGSGAAIEGAGIAARAVGGKGGKGPSKDHWGGQGGTGGAVTVNLYSGASVTTRGANLPAIAAQSLGGQGGDASDGSAIAGQGGGGGYGGNASAVNVVTQGDSAITTSGTYASGILAQSIGGGGGTGSNFVAVLGGQGGNGGNGGDAGTVTTTTAGSITTTGDHSYGVVGQSIAGSGGAGGADTSAAVALGGDGAGGGTANLVTMSNSGAITTSGYSSHGMVGQSIGGGGGVSGSATGLLSVGGSAAGTTGSAGGDLIMNNTGSITTTGKAALGIVGQSIGGGGGSGGDSVGVVGVGGTGSAGGTGGQVTMHDPGMIHTSGDFSLGMLGQSIGGGGGNGGDTFTASVGVSVAIGGSGSGGGDGGSVCMSNAGACDGWTSGDGSNVLTHGDYAAGIVGQSIGGGGGNGGSVKNVSVASVLALQLGGSGSTGGSAGPVEISYSDLDLGTGGQHAIGVLAQSIGGGGGNGGDSSYADATVGFNAALVMGGSGGGGGHGDSAIVSLSNSRIVTGADFASSDIDPGTYAPNDSFGVLAQTVGGGGGNGGSASARDLVLAVPTGEGASVALNLEAAIGGSGSTGSDACGDSNSNCLTQVVLKEKSSVATIGDGSHGVMAQSVGGGGGNGGDSSAMAATLSDGDSISATVGMALGGTGSGGGAGGAVNVTLGDSDTSSSGLPPALSAPGTTLPASSIITYGHFANGVVAQSVGGGGGNGGVGSSNAFSNGGMANVDLTMSLGGTGGAGGVGGEVDVAVNPNFTIRTRGSGSRGIVAQSVGGGGGVSQGGTIGISAGRTGGGETPDEGGGSLNGSFNLTLGATGGSGAVGGKVTAALSGAIRTEGGDADGMLLQSIGGGGGLGGSVGADASSTPILERLDMFDDGEEAGSDEGVSYSFTVGVGATGGSGGHGGEVDLDFGGQIQTSGDWADGILAQSIGGGGGAGGSSSASGSEVQASITLGVGGSGGAAGDGGTINYYLPSSHGAGIATAGYQAYGMLLQSIGGGGGLGGDGSDQAKGELTIGGAHGGEGGASGDGGAIQASQTKGWLNVSTLGDEAPAVAMQSIGGGGGTGGAGSSDSKDIDGDSHAMFVSVGGNAGASGHGGTVNATMGLDASTAGDRAYGMLLQSIGGGGGVGGAGDADNLTSVVLGGRGGAAGDGGNVTVNLNDTESRITTAGAGAHAIVAQSIGGGGGIAGDTSKGIKLGSAWSAANANDAGGSGNGGAVNVTTNGTITTTGANAFGVVAQSIGGGGGLGGNTSGGFAGTTAGTGSTGAGSNVTVAQNGTLTASGSGSTGIFAQSEGPQGSGEVSVTVNGSVTAEAYGVWIVGNNQNYLIVNDFGSISTGSSDTAVHYEGTPPQVIGMKLAADNAMGAMLNIHNAGSIRGNIECARGDGGIACDVDNAATGTLSGATLYQANIDNAGVVAIGKPGAFDLLTVTGDFNLQSEGLLQADVDFVQFKSPRMVVQGETRLDGRIDVRPIALLPEREVTVATLEGDILGTPSALDSPIIDYAARLDGRNVHVKAADADFASESMSLSDNPRSVAQHVQGTWDAGGNSDMAPLYAALDTASRQGSDTYSDRLADLSPGVAVAPGAQMQAGMARFTGAMMSCPTFQGADALTGEQNCLWGEVSGVNTNQDSEGGVSGFSFSGVTYQFGGQRQVSPGWFLGGSAAYQNTHMSGNDGRVSGKGDTGYVGLVLKRETGPWIFSAALGGGYGQHDIDRNIRIPSLESQASADLDVYGAALRLRAARTFATDTYYVKPYVDLDMFYTHMPSYSESRDAMHLEVESSNQFVVGLSPMIEVGGRISLDNGAVMRPYVYGGVSLLSEDEYTVKARLQGAPAGTGSFETSVPTDDVIGRIGAGLQISNAGGIDFRLQYDGEFSSHIQSHRGTLKVMIPF
ncbi:autotransporter outer membrane beta-barrel domain-containing protein [Pusillimonas sp. MFBS29]|uniref:autotransporter outer membrane beta-barrel domain-containing protein n=1 Tax=Pusillimonas sp. MFBS29 TaxID=2886690 RepID=UPI001D10EDA2|nr:autotransporter outer membrane beta-barrel domain-containing protein [Pusillimonas sp. MFBS29]MCC2595869.1 autotransporter outer membrane beta-barrel domain-containing protein [Pusillimonas sp. MFBS29]